MRAHMNIYSKLFRYLETSIHPNIESIFDDNSSYFTYKYVK